MKLVRYKGKVWRDTGRKDHRGWLTLESREDDSAGIQADPLFTHEVKDYPLKHMPSTPMTQEEMKAQCEAVSEVLDEQERAVRWQDYIEETGEVSIMAVAESLDLSLEAILNHVSSLHGARYVGGTSQYLIWKEDAESLGRLYGEV